MRKKWIVILLLGLVKLLSLIYKFNIKYRKVEYFNIEGKDVCLIWLL